MNTYQEIMQAHQELLARYEQGERGEGLVQAAQTYIEAARQAATRIADPRERDQVRANLRFWAAFVFERTGTYPDTTLLPARESVMTGAAKGADGTRGGPLAYETLISPPLSAPSSSPTAQPRPATSAPAPFAWFWTAVIVVGLLALLSIVSLSWQAWRGALSAPTPTSTQSASVVTPSGPTFTATPKVTPGEPTLTPTPTFTPSPSAPTFTPTPTATPPVMMRQLAVTQFNIKGSSCTQRLLTVTLPVQTQALQSAILHVIPNAPDYPSKKAYVGKLQNATLFDLSKEATALPETSYLVGVDAPGLPVVQALIPFTADCQYNQTEVAFDYVTTAVLMKDPPQDPALTLSWRANSWGLMPDRQYWTVELHLIATGGNGSYIYWLDGERLEGDTLWLKESVCRPARHLLGVSSGTRMTVRELVLYAPSLCFAP